ncbi:hypothetical protein LCGC14_2798440, partial [marine sediment metagenome]
MGRKTARSPSPSVLPAEMPAAVGGFLDYLQVECGLADNTRDAYRRDLNQFGAYLAETGRRSLSEVTSESIEGFLRAQHDAGKNPASICRALAAIRMFCRFCLLDRRLPADPAGVVEGRPRPTNPRAGCCCRGRPGRCCGRTYSARSASTSAGPPSEGGSARIPCATASRRSFWPAGRTCGAFRRCSATPTSPPPRSTRTWTFPGSRPFTNSSTPERESTRKGETSLSSPGRRGHSNRDAPRWPLQA